MPDDLFGREQPPPPSPAGGGSLADWHKPLADRLRPRTFDEFLGQARLVGEKGALRALLESGTVPSMILWGPPGSGKTTLAHIVAGRTDSEFVTLSAVTSGVKDVRAVIETARYHVRQSRRTILFVDEIHRFNKAQQDAFLPHVEAGTVVLIGATTENPSFSVISPLLSRCRVFTLEPLAHEDLMLLLRRGTEELAGGFGPRELAVDEAALDAIAQLAEGDGRRALGMLEIAVDTAKASVPGEDEALRIDVDSVRRIVHRHLMYDRGGEEHFNLVSALHKTIRSSDPHAAAYWAQRMMAGGEDPRYLLRRLVRIAAEDVGLADRNAVQHAVACMQAFEATGQPEGNIFVTQLAIYLALAPKSDAVYRAEATAARLVEEHGTLGVPLHLRNAPTKLMKELGYSEGYAYDHDAPEHFAPKQGLPDAIEGTAVYKPTAQGWEGTQRERLARLDAAREEKRKSRKSAPGDGDAQT